MITSMIDTYFVLAFSFRYFHYFYSTLISISSCLCNKKIFIKYFFISIFYKYYKYLSKYYKYLYKMSFYKHFYEYYNYLHYKHLF